MASDIPELSKEAKDFQMGVYEHFRGGRYKIVCIARDAGDASKELVVYQNIEKGYIWTRPLSEFLEIVDRDGYKGPRFRKV